MEKKPVMTSFPQTQQSSELHELEKIQSKIEEVATMYRHFDVLVNMQEEMLMTIGDNIEEVHENIDLGNQELTTFQETLAARRALILKIFAVLIFFCVLFVTVLR